MARVLVLILVLKLARVLVLVRVLRLVLVVVLVRVRVLVPVLVRALLRIRVLVLVRALVLLRVRSLALSRGEQRRAGRDELERAPALGPSPWPYAQLYEHNFKYKYR